MVTAIAHVSTAVDAMKLGAYGYVVKPFRVCGADSGGR